MQYRLNHVEKKDFNKELLSLAIPIGLQNLLIALIGATDAFMLGRFSQDAVSAVSPVSYTHLDVYKRQG